MTMEATAIRPTFGYYRQPNGWITVSPITDLEQLAYIKEGWQPLSKYGAVEMTSAYMAEHPFELLFLRGGASEMPIDQVIGLGFAMNPPIVPSCGRRIDQFHKLHNANCWDDAKPVNFPQLEGLDIVSFPCTLCSRVLPTTKARDQHESVAHKDEKGDIRTGEVLAAAMVKGLRPPEAVTTAPPPGQQENADLLEEIERLKRQLAQRAPKVRRRRASS